MIINVRKEAIAKRHKLEQNDLIDELRDGNNWDHNGDESYTYYYSDPNRTLQKLNLSFDELSKIMISQLKQILISYELLHKNTPFAKYMFIFNDKPYDDSVDRLSDDIYEEENWRPGEEPNQEYFTDPNKLLRTLNLPDKKIKSIYEARYFDYSKTMISYTSSPNEQEYIFTFSQK